MNQNSTEIFYMFRYSFLTQRYLDFVFASNILQDRNSVTQLEVLDFFENLKFMKLETRLENKMSH